MYRNIHGFKTNGVTKRNPRIDVLEGRQLMSTSPIVVNTVIDRVDPAGSATISLRDAIARANASKTPTTIEFSPTVFGSAKTITLTLGKLELTNTAQPVSIIGTQSTLTISGNNHANGLIIDKSVSAKISHLSIVNCTSRGLLNNGTVSLANVILSNDLGGGLKNNGMATLNYVMVQNNNSATDYGGGIFNAGIATLDNVVVAGNTSSSNSGGGIFNSGNITLVNVTVSGNSLAGDDGGGIANLGTLSTANVTIANNTSAGVGGLFQIGAATIADSTVAYNSGVDFGGGLFTYGGNTTLSNTIVANNACSGYGIGPDVYGATHSAGCNLIGRTDGSSGWINTDLTGTSATPLNANLSALAYWGGPTATIMPLAGSPALNSGNNTAIPAGVTTDQRGFPRIAYGTVDVGAVENDNVPISVSISRRYGNELAITATGINDAVAISQSGTTLTIVADKETFYDPAPAGGVFVYMRGGNDSVSIAATVSARTTVDSIDNAPTRIYSASTNVIAWVESSDVITGTASVHAVASFAGGISKSAGAALAEPGDSGSRSPAVFSLLGTAPSASDINQGAVGDCYFLSSLAAFATTRPQVIENSVADLGDGTYVVEFFHNASPVFVRVSDNLSFDYARPGTNDTVWAVVMEKAFAYFRTGANTFASISGGWMSEVYSDLGVQSANFTPSAFTDAQLFNMLSNDLQNSDPVTFATPPTVPGLVGDHAYTLIGTTNVAGVNEYIVRNPWGVSGDSLENSQGIATLTYSQLVANFELGTIATS